ncbi:endonuclease/exonuclease/phosphatase family protein [Aureimonas ureilytica]|uniref:endonuclease/exonuclease/phosphatase family protein n=1 Tax=Aureimonas ureilytica TaxID=401562 RepID=UPI00036578DD|nr:endonuclease/exonuclease/phosphatase family protein [Aureimonas ureilytica]
MGFAALWKGLLVLAAFAGGLGILAGFFGARVHPFDSVAHFRLLLSIALVLLAFVALGTRAWLAMGVALGFAGLGFAFTLPWLLPGRAQPAREGQPSYTLLQMNLRYDAADKAGALRRIGEARPDVVTLQEVTDEWRETFGLLAETYPFQTYCGLKEDRDGIAILSRRPFVGEALCQPRNGRVTQGVDLNGRVLAVTSLHLDWPWPRHQWRQIRGIGDTLRRADGPSLLGGDFNAAPWSAAVGTVAENNGLRVVGGIGPTWLTMRFSELWPRWLGLPLDQLLASSDVIVDEVHVLERTSSDHLPVLLRFSLASKVPATTPESQPPATASAQADRSASPGSA